MAVNSSIKSTTASMKLQIGEKQVKSVSIPGVVDDVDKTSLFNLAKLVNACQAHTMKEMYVTTTTVLAEA